MSENTNDTLEIQTQGAVLTTPKSTAASIFDPWLYEKKIDEQGETGKRFVYAQGIVVTLSPASASRYLKVQEAAQNAIRRAYGKRNIPPKVADDTLIDCIVAGILLGWDNGTLKKPGAPVFPARDGSQMAFNPDNATKVLTDLKRFRDWVIATAWVDDNFGDDVEELQTKN